MEKLFKLALVFVLVFSGCLKAQPKLEIIGGDTYNWGTVKPADNPLKAKVVLKNSGDKVLIINEVRPGCGCTTAPLSKTAIEPGDTASLAITLNVGSNAADVSKSIRITSNDETSPTKHLYIKCKVFYPLEIKPAHYFTFSDMEIGMKKEAKLKIKNNTEESITLSDFSINPSTVQVNVMGKKILKPGEEFELVAIATPDKGGNFNCSVKFKTNNSDMREVALAGYGKVNESIMNDSIIQKPNNNNPISNTQINATPTNQKPTTPTKNAKPAVPGKK